MVQSGIQQIHFKIKILISHVYKSTLHFCVYNSAETYQDFSNRHTSLPSLLPPTHTISLSVFHCTDVCIFYLSERTLQDSISYLLIPRRQVYLMSTYPIVYGVLCNSHHCTIKVGETNTNQDDFCQQASFCSMP